MHFSIFLQVCFSKKTFFKEIYVSGIGTRTDPFLNREFSLLKINNSFEKCNLFGCRQLIDFCSSSNSQKLTFSKLVSNITKNEIIELENLAKQDAFLNIFVDGRRLKLPLFKKGSNRLFTEFNILIVKNKWKSSKTIDAFNSKKLSEGISFNITFNACHVIPEKQQKQKIPIYFAFSSVILALSVAVFFIYKAKLTKNQAIIRRNVWRIPNTIRKTMIFVNIGFIAFLFIIFLLIGYAEETMIEDSFTNIIIAAMTVTCFVYGVFTTIMRLRFYLSEFCIPVHLVHLFVIIPLTIVAECCRAYGESWRGVGVFQAIKMNVILVFIEYFGSTNIGNAGTAYEIKNTINVSEYEESESKKKPFLVHLYDFLFSVLIPLSLVPFLKSFGETILEGQKMKWFDVFGGIFSIIALSGVFSILRTAKIVKSERGTWLEGYRMRSLIAGVITFALSLAMFIPKVEGGVSKTIVVTWCYMAGFACTFVSSFISFVYSFSFAYFSFELSKNM